MEIDDALKSLISSGSKFDLEKLKIIRKELQKYINKDYCLDEVINLVALEIKEKTEEFLYSENKSIAGISTSIFLSPNYHINIMGGSKKWSVFDEIDNNTLFDIASITKLYTGLLVMRLRRLNLIDTSRLVNELTCNFDLKDYSLDDIINMSGIILTPKRLDKCSSKKEVMDTLKHIYVSCNDKSIYNYTDMGLIVLTFILEEIFNMNYIDILDKYLINPLGLRATYFPKTNITGNGRRDNKPNDPKANILNKPIASAGIFTNSEDLVNLSKQIFLEEYFAFDDLKSFCINKTSKAKAAFGSFTHSPFGISKTYVPDEYSKDSFAFEGFTGSITVFDLINKIHNNILVNAVYEDTLIKSPMFRKDIASYQEDVTKASIKIYVMDKYFNDNKSFLKKIKI